MKIRHFIPLAAPLLLTLLLLGLFNWLAAPAPVQAIRAAAPPAGVLDASARITLTSGGFQPAVLTVTAPTTVTWVNGTAQAVTLHSGSPEFIYLPVILRQAGGAAQAGGGVTGARTPETSPLAAADVFSATLPPGGAFSHLFAAGGSVAYYAVGAQLYSGLIAVQAGVPPDPATLAPPLDTSVATSLYSATLFLYSGPNPIQTGVAPGTIDPQRVSVLRGRVLTRGGQPLPGATVSILHHPEYGQTLSRADGMFDLAANGGGLFTIQYSAPGYLAAQRQLDAPWRDYARLPDVVLVPADAQVTAIDLTANTMQIARGGVITDSDGVRRQTLLFPAGATAWLSLSNGLTQTLSTLHVRATEYTVGPDGEHAMPGQLPPGSGYTYATEFSADEAVNAGAKGPQFSQPLIAYNENFLSFPVGITIPAGYYDAARSAWVPMPVGHVLKIVTETNGLAGLDLTGSGSAAGAPALAALGISDAERGALASLYAVGASLWRVTTTHFSSFDWNMGLTCLNNSCVPPSEPPPQLPPPFCSATQSGSIIECQSQALGESVPVVGTDYQLVYRSDQTPGRTAEYALLIPLSGASSPVGLLGISLQVNVAGRTFAYTYTTAPSQTAYFQWDGKDAYGRQVQGSQQAAVSIGYIYHLMYGPCTFLGGGCGGSVGIDPARTTFTLFQDWHGAIGAWNATPEGLGGWRLDSHHSYDPFGMVLYLGDGERRNTSGLDIDRITTAAGIGNTSFLGDGGPASEAGVRQPDAVAVAADGSYYIADTGHNRIRHVDAAGIITTVVGIGSGGYNGDGGPATAAELFGPQGVTLGPDGSLYIADTFNNRIRHIAPDGTISTVAGSGTIGFSGDGGPATLARLSQPASVKVAPDGTLYIADTGNGRIRRVSPDGLISTAAGTGIGGYAGDGGPATQAHLGNATDIAIAKDGGLYIADYGNQRVRRVDATGIITTVAGGGNCGSATCGDGGKATLAQLSRPWGINLGPDGALYIADHDNGRVRRLGTDGLISTAAGGGGAPTGYGGDGGAATQATLYSPLGVALSPDGNLYIADNGNWRIRLVKPVLPQFAVGNILIPSDDGSEVYLFDAGGRHLKTLDALTGATLAQFGFNAAGQLASLSDRAGNVTTIQHDANGHPTTITGPYGQQTALGVDGNGFLSSITNPAGETTQLVSSGTGLLSSLTDPRGYTHHFTYDAAGRLTADQDPAGGTATLARVDSASAYSVTFKTALSRTTVYNTAVSQTGGQRQVTTLPSGLTTQGAQAADGTRTVMFPDGSKRLDATAPDPRWGLTGPLLGVSTLTTTGGLSNAIALARSVSLADPFNPFSLAALTDTLRVNGQPFTAVYNAAGRTLTDSTPGGRQAYKTLDALGRVIQEQVEGEFPIHYVYDAQGRLSSVAQGSGAETRTFARGYDGLGQLAVITDALGQATQFTHDAAGRVLTQTLPAGQMIGYGYDANGNLSLVMPPGQPAHRMAYSALDQQSVYTAPIVSGAGAATAYAYNLDRQLTQVALPDGQMVNLGYDSAGRLSSESIARGILAYTYNPGSGALAALTAPGGVDLAYTYDGPLLTGKTWSGALAGTVDYTYDHNYRLASSRVNGSYTATFQYDADGLLSSEGAMTLAHDPQSGRLTGAVLGGTAEALRYDGFGEPISDSVGYNGAPLFEQRYGFDRLGRVSLLTETNGAVTTLLVYTYDLDGRLTAVQLNGAPFASYGYDANGNRVAATRITFTPAAITATYDAQDRLLLAGSTVYSYTANGDLLARTSGAQTTRYQYDPLGNLVTVTLPSSAVLTYLTDGLNRRVGKLLNGALVQGFLYDTLLNPIAELDAGQNVVSAFVYGSRPNVPDYIVKGGSTFRIVADYLGSPRLVVNSATGQVVQRLDYDEYGRVLTDTNPGFQPFGFAGGLYDRDTGLVRFGARDYDPETGRWTTKDPVRFQTGQPNLYQYVRDDPVNRRDPDGLQDQSVPVLQTQLQNGYHIDPSVLSEVMPCDPLTGAKTYCTKQNLGHTPCFIPDGFDGNMDPIPWYSKAWAKFNHWLNDSDSKFDVQYPRACCGAPRS